MSIAVILRLLHLTDDDSGEKSISVLLSGEESELVFMDHTFAEKKVSYHHSLFIYIKNEMYSTDIYIAFSLRSV